MKYIIVAILLVTSHGANGSEIPVSADSSASSSLTNPEYLNHGSVAAIHGANLGTLSIPAPAHAWPVTAGGRLPAGHGPELFGAPQETVILDSTILSFSKLGDELVTLGLRRIPTSRYGSVISQNRVWIPNVLDPTTYKHKLKHAEWSAWDQATALDLASGEVIVSGSASSILAAGGSRLGAIDNFGSLQFWLLSAPDQSPTRLEQHQLASQDQKLKPVQLRLGLYGQKKRYLLLTQQWREDTKSARIFVVDDKLKIVCNQAYAGLRSSRTVASGVVDWASQNAMLVVGSDNGYPWLLKVSRDTCAPQKEIHWSDDIRGEIHDVVESEDGFILVGYQATEGDRFNRNVLVVSIDRSGKTKWMLSCGGKNDDEAASAIATRNGGVVIGGSTKSKNWDRSQEETGWLLYVSGDGYLEWERSIEGRVSGFLAEGGKMLVIHGARISKLVPGAYGPLFRELVDGGPNSWSPKPQRYFQGVTTKEVALSCVSLPAMKQMKISFPLTESALSKGIVRDRRSFAP